MSKFKRIETPIEGLYIIENTVFEDERGFFMETYNKRDFENMGIDINFVQDNHSRSKRGTLRGLHFQKKYPQDKLVRVIKGEVYDVAVDLRKDSKTLGKWFGVLLSEKNRKQLFIPKDFAHGFITLSEVAEFIYKCSDYYHPEDENGIIWNDPEINIDWPIEGIEKIIMSEKDRKWGRFSQWRIANGI